MESTTSLKMVKGADLESKGDFFTIRHYDTEIFTYDKTTKKAHILLNCSVTSNKQIKRAIEFFDVDNDNVIIKENKEKWGYHR